MKDNKIDELFRQKLSHQKLSPPPGAWEAIEQNLPGEKKKGAYLWLSIAASVLVIFTLGWLAISQNHNESSVNPQSLTQVEKTTPESTVKAEKPEIDKTKVQTEQTEVPANIRQIEEPQVTKLVSKTREATPDKLILSQENEKANELVAPVERLRFAVASINIEEHLSLNTNPRMFRHDLITPLDLTAFYIPYTEDLELAPKKKKFRVLNGIISVAKEVNSGKLSFSELRNAKNSFVEDDLKYGTKTTDGDADGEEKPAEPGKD